ncbi:MATE family efflux transporter [Halococcus sp. IIIV-5B]|uniref:MATE family efflux transporter n=1 Tax=Halococcus sp. IIIV-5B TaxID=2321230 RepID=UPI000E72E23D|nr:MATE family efflux transporter [Halococcus sp. IIIV-5B]RJT05343.1 MATE family efflux transporter [Halococcus sp. IIIV-5B]
MLSVPNPIRFLVSAVGFVLSWLGIIDRQRARRTTDLAWPRIVTGIARMSKNAVDVAMVGIAVGSAGIAGVGFAGPFWGLGFAIGGGIAAGTIALVSQRYGAGEHDGIGQTVRSSTAVVVGLTLPIVAIFWVFAPDLVGLMTSDPRAAELGASYLQVVSLGVPFAALNLIGSRVFIGFNDARTPMILRSAGAVANGLINAALIFGLGMGVVGAAIGTVVSNAVVCGVFATGLVAGRFPGIGEFPVRIDPLGPYLDREFVSQLVDIGTPVMGRNLVWTVAEFPMLAIVGLFGTEVVAAYVIARRIWGLMNTPGWGFGLASSSLVGQELGQNHEETAEAYGFEIVRFAVGVYLLSAAVVFVLSEPIVRAFVDNPTSPAIPLAVSMVSAACIAIVFQGVTGGAAGPLDASGDTRWPFASQAVGTFFVAIPLAYLGATTPLGVWGIYLSFAAETTVPAALNYYRLATGEWKRVSRSYRPGASPADD